MTDFIGGLQFKLGDGGDPTEVFTKINGLVSDRVRQNQPAGRRDRFRFDRERVHRRSRRRFGDHGRVPLRRRSGDQHQLEALQTAVDNKTNKNVQVTVSDGTNTDTYDFAIVPLSGGQRRPGRKGHHVVHPENLRRHHQELIDEQA